MRRSIQTLAIVLISGGLFLFAPLSQTRAEKPFPEAGNVAADQFVAAALKAEVVGQNGERQRLLSQAIQADPSYAPAYWHAGYVSINGKWQSVEAAGREPDVNSARAQYVALRNRTADNVAGNLRLAQWCHAHKLPEESRAHWLRVIGLDPNNAEAHKKLGHKKFGGLWLTKDQIAEIEANQKRLRAADDRWKSRLERLRTRLVHKQETVRKSALKELSAIADADAAVALEHYVAGANQQADMTLVEVLGKFAGSDATLALTRCAVVSAWPNVREAAARQLKNRDVTIYAPLLLAQMYKPVASSRDVAPTLDGGLKMRRVVVVERRFSVDTSVDDSMAQPYAAGGHLYLSGSGNVSQDAPAPLSDRMWNLEAVGRASAQIDAYNEMARMQAQFNLAMKALEFHCWAEMADARLKVDADQFNGRIAATLNIATEQDLPADASTWWRWWDNYTTLTLPTKQQRVAYSSHRVWVPSPEVTSTFVSCFAAGTPVATLSGPRPIETLCVGDLVLSQDVTTGELTYKPVLGTTIRPAMMMLKLTIGEHDESIQCTPHHLFWTNRAGWEKAEDLAAGSYLHGVRGAVPVWTIEPGKVAKTYNLIVDEFQTYFVGKERVLVHDNTMWKPADFSVPGMAMAE